MKKLFCALCATIFVLYGMAAWAAGSSSTVTVYHVSTDKKQVVLKIAHVGDGANGSAPAKIIDNTTADIAKLANTLGNDYWVEGFYLYEVWTVTPASGNPDASDVAITDSLGCTLFTQANVISASASTKTAGTISKALQVNSPLTEVTTNQATNSATWDVYVKLSK